MNIKGFVVVVFSGNLGIILYRIGPKIIETTGVHFQVKVNFFYSVL